MPLLRKKPFKLADPPQILKPDELVYQIRFTKEIFQDYEGYLNRINLYRQRIWTCKISGKANLTYEEALVSEKHSFEKLKKLPEELITLALQIVQFSMLSLEDLAGILAKKFQEYMLTGAKLLGQKEDGTRPCKILKVLQTGAIQPRFEVEWLDASEGMETSVINKDELSMKKMPFGRGFCKCFIRASTYRSSPWVLHESLAKKYGIFSDVPHELEDRIFLKDGHVVNKSKVDSNSYDVEGRGKHKKRKTDGTIAATTSDNEENSKEKVHINYPIDDLLVEPCPDDPNLSNRPEAKRTFKVPMNCVGDLLMVWEFCSYFSSSLLLSPFSLDEFESSICSTATDLTLIVETHSSLMHLLLKENGKYKAIVCKHNRKSKISKYWVDYLCAFLELTDPPDSSSLISALKRGHYNKMDPHVKLGILCDLVNQAIDTDIVREKLSDTIEQRHVLKSTMREQASTAKMKREDRNVQLNSQVATSGETNGLTEIEEKDFPSLAVASSISQNGNTLKLSKLHATSPKDISDGNFMRIPEQHKETQNEMDEKNRRSQTKQYCECQLERLSIRLEPLGKDRYYNRYWWFKRAGRIFVESHESDIWGYHSTVEEIDALIHSLNCKGVRERALHHQLKKLYPRICEELQKRSGAGQGTPDAEAPLRRSARSFLRYVNTLKH